MKHTQSVPFIYEIVSIKLQYRRHSWMKRNFHFYMSPVLCQKQMHLSVWM